MSGRDDGPDSAEKRSSRRIEVAWKVDCETEDTFLFASIANISEMGIFVRTEEPLAIGTYVKLRFDPGGNGAPFEMNGRVQWVNQVQAFGDNPNPGMGVMFVDLTPEQREQLVETVRTIAYLRSSPAEN